MILIYTRFPKETNMKRSIVRATQVLLIVCVAAAGLLAQRGGVPAADKYKISAKAGMVNYSEGMATVTRLDGTTGTLISGDYLKAGDRAITSEGGLAEVLLNPGSYLRLGENSEFGFRVTSLDDLRLDIHRGSAILEVFASNQFRVSVYTPKGRVTLVDTGVYRIDVANNGDALLSVIEGKAIVGEKSIAIVKEGNTATINGGTPVIAKFDRRKRDALASWSRTRSKELAKMASAFNARNTRPMIVDSLIDSYAAGLWGRSRTSGIWVYDPISKQCLFMPYYPGWVTPYGYGYNNCTCYYYLPPTIQPVILPTRLDGRKEMPLDSDSNGNNGARNGQWRPTAENNSSPADNGSRSVPMYIPPPPPPPPASNGTKDRPN